MTREPISLKRAKAAGLLRYYTGRPCQRGHLSERWVSTRHCVECLNAHSRTWKRIHVAKCTVAKRKWCARNRDKVRALKREYYKRNPEDRKQQAVRGRSWYLANAAKSSASTMAWKRRNLARAAATQQRRRTKLLRCLPPWADHAEIQKFYDLVK